MDENTQIPTIDELHADTIKQVKSYYADAPSNEFDIVPFALAVVNGQRGVIMFEGDFNPNDTLALAVQVLRPSMLSLAAATWRKNAEGKRVGEGVLIRTEDADSQKFTFFEVQRGQKIELVEIDTTGVTDIVARVPLLYNPQSRTKH